MPFYFKWLFRCWGTNEHMGIWWIIRGPMLFSIAVRIISSVPNIMHDCDCLLWSFLQVNPDSWIRKDETEKTVNKVSSCGGQAQLPFCPSNNKDSSVSLANHCSESSQLHLDRKWNLLLLIFFLIFLPSFLSEQVTQESATMWWALEPLSSIKFLSYDNKDTEKL